MVKRIMKKYQRLAEQIREQIAFGVWQTLAIDYPAEEQVASSGMSFMTVGHAYQLLESQGTDYRPSAIGWFMSPHPLLFCQSRRQRTLGMKP